MMDVTSMYCLDKLNLYLALVKSSYLEQQVNLIWALKKENLIMLHVNNNGADQPVHLPSLISSAGWFESNLVKIQRQVFWH